MKMITLTFLDTANTRIRYLCGFTLFLSLILNRTYSFILDILKLEQQNKELRAVASKGGDPQVLLKKDQELEALKKQAEGLSREYNELSDRYTKLENQGKTITPKKEI